MSQEATCLSRILFTISQMTTGMSITIPRTTTNDSIPLPETAEMANTMTRQSTMSPVYSHFAVPRSFLNIVTPLYILSRDTSRRGL